jgi:hypothetical protein
MPATRPIHSSELDETSRAQASAAGVLSASTPDASNTGGTAANFRLPSFAYGEVAVASRIAGRRNAARISDSDHNALLTERQLLLDKLLASDITRKERNRLEYVRWQLDRIEDAQHGDATDVLEGAIERYERLSRDMQDLTTQLTGLAKKKR